MNSWNKWYEQAQKYYYKNGNLDMSSRYVDEDGFTLGRWLEQQRAKYKGKDSHGCTISSEEIKKLEDIGMVWDKLEKKWNDYYLASRKYYESNGDLLIPASYVDGDGLKLGRWISNQRQYYLGKSKRGTITQERIEKLDAIGMVWNPLEIQWENNYSLAKLYFENNGHLHIPHNYVTKDGIKLGAWIGTQRSKYFHRGDGELTVDQITKLERIGMIWNHYDEEWMNYFLLAKEYYEQNGDLLVPLRYVTDSGEQLGAWISRQRRKRSEKRGTLTPKQETLLDSIGMEWDPNEAQFEEQYAEATNYFLNVGDLEVDCTFISSSGMKLGRWISYLRKAYKQGILTEERIRKLEKIGMNWEKRNNPLQTSYPEQIVFFYIRREFSDALNRYTELGFELDIYIPSIKVGIEYDGVAWHNKDKQVSDNKKNNMCRENNIKLYRLREENCPKLNGISIDINVGKYSISNVLDACKKIFEFFVQKNYLDHVPELNYSKDIVEIRNNYKNAKDETWNLMYRAAAEYYQKNGDLRVPYNYTTDSGLLLGSWITNQRSNYFGYSGTGIDSDRVILLEKIGMVWSVPKSQWKKGYDEAKKYYDAFGNINVKIDYVTSTGYRLGIWIRTQRKNNNLSQEQIRLLDDLGMVWSMFDEKWEKGFIEAKRYYDLHGDLKVPAGFYTESEYPLGNWIAAQRNRYSSKDGKRALNDEQTKRLESIGMIWDIFEDSWKQGYAHAKEYYNENGNLHVPGQYVCSDGYALGHWIQCRRCGYNGIGSWAKPSEEQIEMLEKIGMIWNVEEHMWNKNYLLAKEYYEKHGNLAIPKRYETPNGEKLGLWIQRQRRLFSEKTKKQLSDERIRKLNEIGIVW